MRREGATKATLTRSDIQYSDRCKSHAELVRVFRCDTTDCTRSKLSDSIVDSYAITTQLFPRASPFANDFERQSSASVDCAKQLSPVVSLPRQPRRT